VFNSTPKPLGILLDTAHMPDLAHKIADRIRGNRHACNSGSYLLAAKDGTVYVLAEQRSATERMVAANPALLVGFYAGDTPAARVRCPSAEEIADDLEHHLAGLRGGEADA